MGQRNANAYYCSSRLAPSLFRGIAALGLATSLSLFLVRNSPENAKTEKIKKNTILSLPLLFLFFFIFSVFAFSGLFRTKTRERLVASPISTKKCNYSCGGVNHEEAPVHFSFTASSSLLCPAEVKLFSMCRYTTIIVGSSSPTIPL